MQKQMVYDAPTRIFHWLFASLFLLAFLVAKNVEDDSVWFCLHMLSGLTLGFVVVLRALWGFFGTRHARFSNFALNPKDAIQYFKGILTGDKRRWAGHNPASSWAALIMMALGLALATTGILMTTGQKETFEDIHEYMANGFMVVVVGHILGIVIHTIRHKEWIGLSMMDGQKANVAVGEGIAQARWGIAAIFIFLVAVYAANLYRGFDQTNRQLSLFGWSLQLGEAEGSN